MIAPEGCPSEEELLVHLAAPGGQVDSEKLLAHFDECASCRMAMAEATRALAAPSGQSSPPPALGIRTLSLGERVLGRYEIRRFIARGGMGEVYEAFDLLLDERVALKTLASTVLDDDRAAFRFKGEVRLARKVTHLNVCRILEFGVHARQNLTEESVPFLTMEFLSGETLAQRITKRGPYTPAEARPLLHQILAGLKAIHDAGIVHRDLKSENVFLVADPRGEERAVLMDFGLARAVDGSVPTTMPHRLAGLAGTIDCMAPEQIHGGVPVGPAADMFALGVLIYELLSAQRPFVRVPPWQRLNDPSPRLATVAPHLPRGWDALVRRCLERKPDDRFGRLEEVLAALPQPAHARPWGLWLAAAAATAAAIAAAVVWKLG